MELHFDDITTDPIAFFDSKAIEAAVLRLDKIHPVISGNKWFKLRYYISEALESRKNKIVTFGGAWSNHIVATAAACQMNNIGSIGIIRGEKPLIISPTLEQAVAYGMQLYFVSRDDFREKSLPPGLQPEDHYLINEGGYGKPGALGASTILDYAGKNYTHYCCAVGTGTMMAGLINSIPPGRQVTGISVMKNNRGLETKVQSLSSKNGVQWQIIHDYHFGGYARHKPELIAFMNEFYRATGIPTDFVYTGRLFYAVNELAASGFFPRGSRILLIHSGGLQGNNSLEKGTLIY